MTQTAIEDRYLWLEDVEGEKALDWVRARNAVTEQRLGADPGFEGLRRGLLEILDSSDRIPMVGKHGAHYYNFWQDADHPRGLYRRTTLDSYRSAEPDWEVLLDVDALNAAEGENWVFHGVTYLEPQTADAPYVRCLISLSRGGSDADVTREFDLERKAFVEDGFFRPEAKGGLVWIDHDRVYVYSDFGPGTLTESGYPRIVKEWRRGTPMHEADVVYEGLETDMYIAAGHDQVPGYERDFVVRAMAFYESELYLRDPNGSLVKVDVPDSAEKSVHRDWLLVLLRDPWEVAGASFSAGSLLGIGFEEFMAGDQSFHVVFEPDERTSLAAHAWTRNHLLVNVLEDVKNRVSVVTPAQEWRERPLVGAPSIGTVGAWGVDEAHSDEFFMTVTDFLTPPTLWMGEVDAEPELLKSMPAFFDADGLSVEQRFATSEDGTRVPYFVVGPAGGGPRPTVLYGYGGFEQPLVPAYMPLNGRGWQVAGGVLVIANIRGGGEYGPRWHQAALKANRPRAYEDFAAVARDLVETGVTTVGQLGAMGGSNGGLLVGNMLVRYPELFGAIVCQVPLLDMRRYHKLLAGASWMAEYGDPDIPEEWTFIQGFSPYHQMRGDRRYPPVLFTTSTRDDRVHPGHARKMAALMEELGHEVLYWENIEGGHGGAADNAQRAYMSALEYSFLWQHLGGSAGADG